MLKNKNTKGLLIALALGDGYLRSQKNSYYLQIEHCARQFNYINYKKELIEDILGCKPIKLHKRIRTDPRTNKTQTSFIVVKGHRYFKILKRFMYRDNKKILTKSVLNFLSPLGLAIWYMDDGFLNGNIASLATYCNEQEADIIINFFRDNYNLNIRKYFHKHMQSYYHAFDVENSNKFYSIIYNYIIPDMKYKIPGSYIPRVLDNT